MNALFLQPVGMLAFQRAPGDAAQAADFVALHSERNAGGAGKTRGQPDIGAKDTAKQLGADLGCIARRNPAGEELPRGPGSDR
jgi:hypothetical protein